MLKLEITFESKTDLIEFLTGSAVQMAEQAPVAKEKKKKKSKVVEEISDATQEDVRAALKQFASDHDPASTRKFLESRGTPNVSAISASDYGKVLVELKAYGEKLSNG